MAAGDDFEVISKKDPIVLALEKESQAFDPEIYMQKGEGDGTESAWLNTEVFY